MVCKINERNNAVLEEIFEEYCKYPQKGFAPCYTYDPIFNILQYYKMWAYNKELSRIKYDGDARYFNSLKGDTMISFWTPYERALKFATGENYYKTKDQIDELMEKRNSSGYREVNKKFMKFAELNHTPGNFILLPDGGPDNAMNPNRYRCSQDRIDKSLLECFPGGELSKYFGNDEKRLKKWIQEQKLDSLFEGVIEKGKIKPLNKRNPFVAYSEMNEGELYEFIDNAVELIKRRAEKSPAGRNRPPVSIPHMAKDGPVEGEAGELKQTAQILMDTLKSFDIQTKLVDIHRGAAVTQYEIQPAAGVKISEITSLADDIALNLASSSVRIEAPIPGKTTIGVEIPNKSVSVVGIRELIDSPEFEGAESNLTAALGRDIGGNVILADIAQMPHMLMAGSTGSGKSVCINSIIISLLYKALSSEVKFVMIDAKDADLCMYNGIPHLLMPVVTEPQKAVGTLDGLVAEALRRYNEFTNHSVHNLADYNNLAETRGDLTPMSKIVTIINELGDLMMCSPNEAENSICRLAQMGRAVGIHLIICTQRTSVDVITSVIKANIPSRIAFAVSSLMDSHTILDTGGAEKLIGCGDMLFYSQSKAKPQRVQGCFATKAEVKSVVECVKTGKTVRSIQEITVETDRRDNGGDYDDDNTLPQDIEGVSETGITSTLRLQRLLKRGYARTAEIIEKMGKRSVNPGGSGNPKQDSGDARVETKVPVDERESSRPDEKKSTPKPDVSYRSDFKVKHIKDGCAIKKYIGKDKSSTVKIAIPDRINGEPVIMITDEAFHDFPRLKSIDIPNSVTHIGAYAFAKCTNLESITIPDSVIKIGKLAFVGCTRLKTVNIHANKKSVSIARGTFPKHTVVNFING